MAMVSRSDRESVVEPQRRRSFYLCIAACLGLAFLFVVLPMLWFAAFRRPAVAPVAVIFPPPESGRIAHVNSKTFFVALVTNTTSGRVVLDTLPMLVDEWCMAIAPIGLWCGTSINCCLGPGQVVSLPIVVPKDSTKFTISFGYSADANGLQKLLSPVCRNVIQPGRIPASQNIEMRLFEQGWIDGRLHLNYQSGWRTNR